jgi:hypothetical protein
VDYSRMIQGYDKMVRPSFLYKVVTSCCCVILQRCSSPPACFRG